MKAQQTNPNDTRTQSVVHEDFTARQQSSLPLSLMGLAAEPFPATVEQQDHQFLGPTSEAGGSKLLRLMNKPADGETEAPPLSSNGEPLQEASAQQRDRSQTLPLSTDEAHLFALLRQYNSFRKLSGETQHGLLAHQPTPSSSSCAAVTPTQSAIEKYSNIANEIGYPQQQSDSFTSPLNPKIGTNFASTPGGQQQSTVGTNASNDDPNNKTCNGVVTFATPNKFYPVDESSSPDDYVVEPNTAATSSITPTTVLSSSGCFRQHLPTKMQQPSSAEQEMSDLVDNLLTGEDYGVPRQGININNNAHSKASPAASSLSAQKMLLKDVTNTEDEFESCSQFLVGSDLVYILNEHQVPMTAEPSCEPRESVSTFKASPDCPASDNQLKFVPAAEENQATSVSQKDPAVEINRVKIETKPIGAIKSPPITSGKENSMQKTDDFDFPDGGWVCSGCQNYNFFGRQKCNRCLKIKSKLDLNGKPKHLLRQQKNQKKEETATTSSKPLKSKECVRQSATVTQIQSKKPTPPNNQPSQVTVQSQTQSTTAASKLNAERVGDWVCIACTNLNFAFRQVCNRCWRDRTQTATMVLQDQSELQKFQSAGCTTSYLQLSLGAEVGQARRQAQTISRPVATNETYGALNSDAACFQPGVFVHSKAEAAIKGGEHADDLAE